MGEQNVKLAAHDDEFQDFVKHLLKDVQALELMLNGQMFETGITRIGAEQELCLIDDHFRPAPLNLEILEKANNPYFTSELAKYNFEINLEPLEFKHKCLSQMESNISKHIAEVEKVASEFGVHTILAGILPTIRKFDIQPENLTPLERYKALVESISKMRGGAYELRLRGVDELIFKTDSPLLEACNTGFQVHMQVEPATFTKYYNISQAIAAPVLAIATNSPMLFGKRLWSETRIALFQQSVDTRITSEHLRESSPRVTFGNSWVKDGILEIYKEDISRFRALLSSDYREDVFDMLSKGKIPKLMALNVHNSTVYRWNRACYGVADNIPHLRIENRVLPSGPTVVDEMANTAFWLGLMKGIGDNYDDITNIMEFDHAKSNMVNASRHGLDTHFRWINGKRYSVKDLIREELLPIAREGLASANIDESDIEHYLGIIEARNDSGITGSHWILESFEELKKVGTRDESLTSVTAGMWKNQQTNKPVHEWPMAKFSDIENWEPQKLLVEEFMTTDLFTAQKSDILEFVADMMDWRRIRYMPVEDEKGFLIGLITSRILLRNCIRPGEKSTLTVDEVMIKDPLTIHPEATILEAMNLMQENRIGCLPIVKNNKLVGIITEQNYMEITRGLIVRLSKKSKSNKSD
jgi:CBS domain-containing protein/gamma-glutamylcysteine synthetase